MMWRHRFVDDSWDEELPGGIVDKGEDGATTAGREVREETGWQPAPLEHVLSFQPMVGMVDTPHEIYAGRGAELVGEPTDLEEAMRIEWIPMSTVFDLISRGEVLGSGSLVGLLYLPAQRGDKAGSWLSSPRSLSRIEQHTTPTQGARLKRLPETITHPPGEPAGRQVCHIRSPGKGR